MKRFIFSSIAMVLVATSCTESGLIETPDFYGNAIVFNTYIGRTPVTKAVDCDINYLMGKDGTDVSGKSIPGAHIYAYTCEKGNRNTSNVSFATAYLDGQLICTNQNNPTWQYRIMYENAWENEEAFWPTEKDLMFTAYNLKAESQITSISMPQLNFKVADNVSDQVDLLVTPATFVSEVEGADTPVTLVFNHLLSRVGFKIKASDATDVDIVIENVKLCGAFPKNGYVNLASIAPIIQPTGTEYATSYSLLSEAFSINAEYCSTDAMPIYSGNVLDRYMMIMPGTQTNAYIEVEYHLSGETNSHYSKHPLVIINDDKSTSPWIFEAGHAYEFIFTISTAAIEFEAEVSTQWGDPEPPIQEKPLVP